jgi:hypothetical protein
MFASPLFMTGMAAMGDAVQFVGYAAAGGAGSAVPSLDLTALTGGIGLAAATGDVVVAAIFHACGSDDRSAVSIDGGFTTQVSIYEPGSSFRDSLLEVGYKVMGGTPDTSITFTGNGVATHSAVVMATVWRGADAATPIDVTPATASDSGSNMPDPPGIAGLSPGAPVLVFGGGATSNADYTLAATGFDLFVPASQLGTIAASAGIGVASAPGASFDPAQWTDGATNAAFTWVAATLALRPA